MKLISHITFACWVACSLTLLACGGAQTETRPTAELTRTNFESLSAFQANLEEIGQLADATERQNILDTFWQKLLDEDKIPFAIDDHVAFLYRSKVASSVAFQGDWNWFGGATDAGDPIDGVLIAGTDVWLGIGQFPSDAKLDYKIVVDQDNWILDPANDRTQLGGLGANSVLWMPDYVPSPAMQERPETAKGTLSENITITSTVLGYDVHYRVYVPSGYDALSDLAVLYITDGQDYAHQDMGRTTTILDNLIADSDMPPVMAVFIDPRDVVSGANQRVTQFVDQPAMTAQFLVDELVPAIDDAYQTRPDATHRGIVGTSFGGKFSAFVCFHHAAVFGVCAIQSPAAPHEETAQLIRNSDKLPVRIALQTGAVGDLLAEPRGLRDLLKEEGYELFYLEVSQGHSWGNWSDFLDEMFVYLLPADTSPN